MLKISRTLVYEPFILEAIQGARLSWASTHKSDSQVVISGQRHEVVIGPEDEKLIKNRLLGGAAGEDKFLRAIPVSVWFEAPLRWFFDADTYKIGTVKQSSSLMHYFKSRGELTAANFTETTDQRLIDIANEKYRAWVAAGGKTNFTSREWEEFQTASGAAICIPLIGQPATPCCGTPTSSGVTTGRASGESSVTGWRRYRTPG